MSTATLPHQPPEKKIGVVQALGRVGGTLIVMSIGWFSLGVIGNWPTHSKPLTMAQRCAASDTTDTIKRMFHDTWKMNVMDVYDAVENHSRLAQGDAGKAIFGSTASQCKARVVTDRGELMFLYSFVDHNGREYVEGHLSPLGDLQDLAQ